MTTPWTNRHGFLDQVWKKLGKLPQYRNHMKNIIVDILRANPEYTMLDLGCGTGLTYEYLPDMYKPRYRGMDFTESMVMYCKEKYPEGRFIHGDLLKHDSYPRADLLMTQNVLQHILMWQEAMRGIYQKKPEIILMCERTSSKPTHIVGYSPAVRWAFNVDDYRRAMDYYGGDDYTATEVLGHPRNTKNDSGLLTIYRTRRK